MREHDIAGKVASFSTFADYGGDIAENAGPMNTNVAKARQRVMFALKVPR